MSSYELVYQKLRENILNGHYKHGDELRETAVGKEIGVSRTPVREALRQLELEGHYDQLFKLDSRFHSLLYEACKSKILEHELKIFHQYVQQVRKNALKKEARAEQSTKEHMAVMEAIKAHNADEADRLATRHILNSIKNHHYTKIEKLLEEQP